MTSLFEVISDKSIKNEIIEKVGNDVVKKIDICFCKLTIGIKIAVINGVATGIFDRRILL